MIKLSVKERACLKIFHLLSVAAWLGGQMTLILIQSTKSQLAVPGDQYAIITSLKEIDDVAYLRFASVYKDFKSADSFRKEVEKMET